MSTNVDSIRIIEQDGFGVSEQDFEGFAQLDLPDSMSCRYAEFVSGLNNGSFWWNGERSGSCYHVLLEQVLPKFTGRADMLVCWEGGNDYEGLRVVDGVVTEHEVIFALGDELSDEGDDDDDGDD